LKKCTPQKRWRSASGSTPAKRVDAQARRCCSRAPRARVRSRDLAVQVLLPVHAFGDRFDHQVAAAQQFEPGVVIRRHDAIGQRLVGERSGGELREVGDGLDRDAVGRTFFRRQVEQHRIDAGIGQVRGDLRAHHARAEHGGPAYKQFLRHVT
jgi:hypothetical protein